MKSQSQDDAGGIGKTGDDPALYLRRFFSIGLGLVLCVAAINGVVDPYDRFGLNRLGVFVPAEREFKTTEVERFPHDSLLIGNSRAAVIPASELRPGRFFNAGFGGARLDEIEFFLDAHLKGQKTVVLGLDPYLLGMDIYVGDTLTPGASRLQEIMGYIIGSKTLEYSWKTVWDSLRGKPARLKDDGTIRSDGWQRHRELGNADSNQEQIEEGRRLLGRFAYGPERMERCRAIGRLVQSRGARLFVYLGPVHEDVLPVLEEPRIRSDWKRTVKECREIFPGILDFTRGDFSGRTNFFETLHFVPEVGVSLINERLLPGPGQPDP
jgi:hypothetical protein